MKKIKLFLFAAMLLGSVGLHASNTITYTATAQLPGYNGSLNVGATTFGSAIVSHEFSNGTGVITCAGEITTIGAGAFYYCTGLTSITIPNSVITIRREAFYYCNGLTSVTIGNSVKTIGDDAFYNCSGLTSITIPNSVTTIGSSAFYACSGLTSVTIGNSVATIGQDAFGSCRGLTSITIPNSVTTIGYMAFEYCSGLTSVTIGNSVTSIGANAFYYCTGLTSIIIPNSVTSIGELAFYGCSGLTVVTVSWTDEKSIPSIYSNVFKEIAHGSGPAGAKLYVPKGTEELYQQADEWKTFGDIESDIIKINNLWYRPLNVRTANLIANQDTTTTGERIPYSGDVVIPKTAGLYNIATIEDSAFYNAKLTSLTVLTDIPLPCEQYTFLGQDKSIPVYVLDVDAFNRAEYWNKFTNIQFYAPYRDAVKQKLADAAKAVPSGHSEEAKAIAEAYGKKMDGLNTAAAIDKLYAEAMDKMQVFMDEALWTLDKTGCMILIERRTRL